MKKYMVFSNVYEFVTACYSFRYEKYQEIKFYQNNYQNIRPKPYGIFLHTHYHGGSFTDKQGKRKEGQRKFCNVFVKTREMTKGLGNPGPKPSTYDHKINTAL